MEIEELKSKVKKFIIEFRKIEAEKGEIGDSQLYLVPCQTTMLWFQNEKKDDNLQIFIFTHWNDEKDLEVDVYGPIKLSEFIPFSKSFIEKEKWSRTVNTDDSSDLLKFNWNKPFFDERYQYSKIIELILFEAYKKSKKDKSPLNYRNFQYLYWIFTHKFQDMNISNEIEKLFQKQYGIRDVDKNSNIFRGVYTYFYPPLWIGPPPSISFEDRINNFFFSEISKTYKTNLKGYDIILKSDGFIALEIIKQKKAIDMINLIMALVFLSGIDAWSIGDRDLMSIVLEKSSNFILEEGYYDTNIRYKLRLESKGRLSEVFSKDMSVTSEKRIKKIIKKVEVLFDNKEIFKSLIFLIESYTHLVRHRYSQSFIMNWITIERYINNLWQKFIKDKGYTGKRKKFLKNDTRTWTVASRIEILNISGLLSDNDYRIINGFRDARNRFTHDKKMITRHLSKECLDFTKSLIIQMIGEFDKTLIPL